MPQTPEPTQHPAQPPAVEAEVEFGDYPPQAYCFVHEGLDYTVKQLYGPEKPGCCDSRHVTGQQLCQGLAELARHRWGRMSGTVLGKWGITNTLDFGRIVYSMIEMGQMQKVEDDSIDDFKNVYQFETAFEAGYSIPSQP